MSELVKASTVAILYENESTAGTGFIISSEGLIVTCAHVIEVVQTQRIRVKFYGTNEIREASVVPGMWRPEGDGDIAILKIEGELPGRAKHLPLGMAEMTEGHEFYAFSLHRNGRFIGLADLGKSCGMAMTDEETGIRHLQLQARVITKGFSGAPVWDMVRRKVIGMVTEIGISDPYRSMDEVAIAIPTNTIREVCPELYVHDISPYQGLNPFTEGDADLFFGRTQLIDKLVSHLNSVHDEQSFLAVLGPAHCGKSSLVQAGLIRQLRKGRVADSNCWHIVTLKDFDDPFQQLVANELTENLVESVEQWMRKHHSFTRLVLILDQFEDIFIKCGEDAQKTFINQLTILLNKNIATVILIMRDDYYTFLARHEALITCVEHNLINVPPIYKKEDLFDIARGPAEKMGLTIEDGLVERIIEEAMSISKSASPDHEGTGELLPHYELLLTQLWRNSIDGKIAQEDYNPGILEEMLAQWADAIFNGLNDEQQELAKHIFIHLTLLNKEGKGRMYHRQRKSLAVLCQSTDKEDSAYQVVQKLVDEQLLTMHYDFSNKEEMVEIAQDIIYEWPILRQWLDDEARFVSWYQAIDEKASLWFETNADNITQRDEGKLLSEHEIAEIEEWQAKRACALNAKQQSFIQASQTKLLEKHHQIHDEEARQRYAIAYHLAAQAEIVGNRQSSCPLLGVLLAAESIQRYHLLEADQILRYGLDLLPRPIACLSHIGALKIVAYTYDGRHFATLGSDGAAWVYERSDEEELAHFIPIGEVSSLAVSFDGLYLVGVVHQKMIRIWETHTRRHVKDLSSIEAIQSIAFCPGEYYLIAVACQDGVVLVWDILNSHQYCSLPHAHCVNELIFSADGDYLATISGGQMVKIWEWSKSRLVGQIHHKAVIYALSFNPDAHMVAIACQDKKIEIWTNKGKRCLASLQHEGPVHAIAWNRDGSYIAAASDNLVKMWKVEQQDYIEMALCWHEKRVNTLAFSFDGKRLVTASDDHTAKVWEVASGIALFTVCHEEKVQRAFFSQDDQYLVTTSNDGTASIWELTPSNHRLLLDHRGDVRDVAFSPDGKHLVTASSDGTAILWDVASGSRVMSLPHEKAINGAAFSVDGCYVMTGSVDHTVTIWNAANGGRQAQISCVSAIKPAVLSSHHAVAAISFGTLVYLWSVGSAHYPDTFKTGRIVGALNQQGTHLTLACDEGIIEVWSLSTGELVGCYLYGYSVGFIVCSVDGQYIAITSTSEAAHDNSVYDDTIKVWKIGEKEDLLSWKHNQGIKAIALSPDGIYLAVASFNHTTRIINIAHQCQISLLTHADEAFALAFSPDSSHIAIATEAYTVEIWETETGHQIACLNHGGKVNALAFSPDGRYLATASEDHYAYLWLWRAEDLLAEAGKRVNRNLTSEEWREYMANEPYRGTFPHLPD